MKPTMMRAGCVVAALAVLVLSACTDRGAQAGPEAAAPVPEATAVAPAAQAAAAPAADGQLDAGPGAPADGGNSDADVDQAIDSLLGDHQAYRDVFERLKQGIAAGDKAAVAALVTYPLEVQVDGAQRRIDNAGEFVAAWDRIVTPGVVQAVAGQEYRDLFVNAKGVMLGDGQVWITGTCRDNACASVEVGVGAIQEGPQ